MANPTAGLPAGLVQAPLTDLEQALIPARDWLHVIRLPAYAPDLNPVQRVWSHLERSQYRPELAGAFFAQTGLTLDSAPP
ncbi:putative transposase [Kutzneria viridogrisea]|uniref:Transposase n=1 Tax=Kutzneria viridogrisea TaxID=47990 RepID=A0ABR6BV50_9PSEU|nr:transposase [Kutzneria albida]MBA8930793.1 putative transposase [Kutzneria viridogrisea]